MLIVSAKRERLIVGVAKTAAVIISMKLCDFSQRELEDVRRNNPRCLFGSSCHLHFQDSDQTIASIRTIHTYRIIVINSNVGVLQETGHIFDIGLICIISP